ncbi:MAG: hypothetical protein IT379_29410 [Deltaproteobacteria bacterium]|nr:hypothetical protein [Deltaproteobacteria bacterium]
MTGSDPTHEDEESGRRAADRAVAVGWAWLALCACGGLALEVALGLKLGWLLDDEGVRTMARLAHAHGVGLALVVLAFGATAAPRLGARTAATSMMLIAGAVLVPIGFALGAIGHGEVDPGPGVWLVPPGALLVIGALVRTSIAAIGYARRNRNL